MNRKNKHNFLIDFWSIVSAVLVISIILFIFIYIFVKGFGVVDFKFITSRPKGSPMGSDGGIFPAILGTLYLACIAALFSSILALSTAIYCSFYCKNNKIKSFIHLCIQCIAGIPSIVLGLFGYAFLVLNLGLGRSLLASGLTLGIMIFPYIEVRVEKLFNEVPREVIESSYALGVSKSYTFMKIVIPYTLRGIISSITMASGFAMGATSPIILTGAVLYAPTPKSLLSPVMALPSHLYMLLGEGISVKNAYGTTVVLLFLVLIINLMSLILTFKKKEI